MKNIIPPLLVLTFLTACNGGKSIDEKPDPVTVDKNSVKLSLPQVKNAGITTGKPLIKTIAGHITCNGVLEVPPQNLVSISAMYGGFVKNTELLEGMRIKKGQVICTLEHPDYIQLQEDYLSVKSKYDFARLEYERQKELGAENVLSQKSVQERESEFLALHAKVEGLRQKLSLINIQADELIKGKIQKTITLTSPIDGYVKEVNVNMGKYVDAHEVMFEIVDNRHLHAELTVFEKDIPKIKEGQKIKFTLPNEGSHVRSAVVHLIGHNLNNDKTLRVHGHLDKEDDKLLPGMYIKAQIEVVNSNAACLPDEAILLIDNRNYIFTETAYGVYKIQEVITGISYNGFTEIETEGFKENKIVLSGAHTLYSIFKNRSEPTE